jgi:hypothetical protein
MWHIHLVLGNEASKQLYTSRYQIIIFNLFFPETPFIHRLFPMESGQESQTCHKFFPPTSDNTRNMGPNEHWKRANIRRPSSILFSATSLWKSTRRGRTPYPSTGNSLATRTPAQPVPSIRSSKHHQQPQTQKFPRLRPHHGQNPSGITSRWYQISHTDIQCCHAQRIIPCTIESIKDHPPLELLNNVIC